MNPIAECVEILLETLSGGGINCAADPQKLNLPGCWVTPAQIEWLSLAGGSARVTCDIYLIAQNHGYIDDVNKLDVMVSKAAPLIDTATWQVETINLTNQSADSLPCLHGQAIIEWRK